LNLFGCPSSSYTWHVELKNGIEDEDKSTTNTSSSHRDAIAATKAAERFYTNGVWPRIKHSCCGNASRSFIGDALILRAAADLAAGGELAFAYIPVKADDLDKRVALNRASHSTLGFERCCAL
jgi:hypothetical protein